MGTDLEAAIKASVGKRVGEGTPAEPAPVQGSDIPVDVAPPAEPEAPAAVETPAPAGDEPATRGDRRWAKLLAERKANLARIAELEAAGVKPTAEAPAADEPVSAEGPKPGTVEARLDEFEIREHRRQLTDELRGLQTEHPDAPYAAMLQLIARDPAKNLTDLTMQWAEAVAAIRGEPAPAAVDADTTADATAAPRGVARPPASQGAPSSNGKTESPYTGVGSVQSMFDIYRKENGL